MKQPEYSLSYHPVWKILDEWGLPDELINIVFGFKTYSIINECMEETDNMLNNQLSLSEYEDILLKLSSIFDYDEKLLTLRNSIYFMISYPPNKIINKFFFDFISLNGRFFYKNNECIKKIFIKYYDDYFDNYLNQKFNNIFFLKKDKIIDLNIIKNIKILLVNDFSLDIKKINNKSRYNIFSNVNNYHYLNMNKDEILYYKYEFNRFDLKLLWKNFCYLLKIYNYGIVYDDISKTDIIMFNFMSGLYYNKDWSEQKLYDNLIKNEWPDNSLMLDFFRINNISMLTLYNMLYKNPFSSDVTIKGTLNRFISLLS